MNNYFNSTVNILLVCWFVVFGVFFGNYFLYPTNPEDFNFITIAATITAIPFALYLIISYTSKTNPVKRIESKKSRRDFILYIAAFLIPAKDRDFEIGNMIEIYEKDKKRFGQKRALKLLAFDVIKSVYPLVKRAIGLIVRTALRTLGLYKIYKSFWG